MSGSDRHNPRIGSLFVGGDEERSSHTNSEETSSSIPFPAYEEQETGSETVWDASGAMTLEDFRRVRQGYERRINPDALDRMHAGAATDDNPEDGIVRARPAPYTQPVTPDQPLYAPTDISEQEVELSDKRKRGRLGPVGVTFVLVAGFIGALALYAGGIEAIAGLFSTEQSATHDDLTRITDRPGDDDPVLASGGPTPSEQILDETGQDDAAEHETAVTDESEQESDPEPNEISETTSERMSSASASEDRSSSDSRDRKAQTASSEEGRSQEETDRIDKEANAQPTNDRQNSSLTTNVAIPRVTSFSVQIGATPDKSEADRIAAGARSRGGSGVRVVETTRNGETLYRVRFGTFSTQEEAQAKSTAIGYNDVWIVRN